MAPTTSTEAWLRIRADVHEEIANDLEAMARKRRERAEGCRAAADRIKTPLTAYPKTRNEPTGE